MRIDDETCYRALAARDARFDGLFFVGVTSTRDLLSPDLHGADEWAAPGAGFSRTRRWRSARDFDLACVAGPSWLRGMRRWMRFLAPPGRPLGGSKRVP